MDKLATCGPRSGLIAALDGSIRNNGPVVCLRVCIIVYGVLRKRRARLEMVYRIGTFSTSTW